MKLGLLMLGLTWITLGFAQKSVSSDDMIYDFVADGPEFPGGETAMSQFISETIDYPSEALKNNEQGTVYVKFVVRKDGSIEKIQVLKSVSKSIDQEAIRVIKQMPKWKPGMQKGEPVNVYYTMPVRFRIPDGEKEKENQEEEEVIFSIPPDPEPESPDSMEEPILMFPEVTASFPGGDQKMNAFIFENIRYPELAKEKGIQGDVYLSFVVEKDGTITNIRVLRKVDDSLEKEAIRVIESMPKWIPAKQNGELVRSMYRLPIKFYLG